jgi:phosphoribosylformimino-5-aminoimidazole carboxamide ribotide isomerase
VLVVPSLDLQGGRSRLVHWPGASAGAGTPSDRPEVIARHFVEQGARMLHLVDLDGARAGAPANLDAVGAIAGRVAVPLQLAGGMEEPDAIRLAFAAGATRVVVSVALLDRPAALRACLDVAGDWLAVGLDARPDRLAAFPWHRPSPPSLDDLVRELAALGVVRFILAHGGIQPDPEGLRRLVADHGVELLVAGGVVDLPTITRLRDAGVTAVILGEPLLTGSIELPAALEAAA